MKNGLNIDKFGVKRWYRNNHLHREDGPAVIRPEGYSAYYQDGLRHRTDGPAIIYEDGDKEWYYEDNWHRLDGPALDYVNAKTWYYHGEEIYCDSQEEYEEYLRLLKLKAFW